MNTFYRLLAAILVVAFMSACEIGVRAKVDSQPSDDKLYNTSNTIYGTTDEACTYEIAPDGKITLTAGRCPITADGKILTSRDSNGCEYEITRTSRTLVKDSCKRFVVGDVTTTLTHGPDGCDYALAQNGETSKVPGSCLKDVK
jgi:hypothetical protein